MADCIRRICVLSRTPGLLVVLAALTLSSGPALALEGPLRLELGGGHTIGAERFDVFGPAGARAGSLNPTWTDAPLGALTIGYRVFGRFGVQGYVAAGGWRTADGVGSGLGLHSVLDLTVDVLRAPVIVGVGLGAGVSALVSGNMGRDADLALSASLSARYGFGATGLGLQMGARALVTDSVDKDTALALGALTSVGVYYAWGGTSDESPDSPPVVAQPQSEADGANDGASPRPDRGACAGAPESCRDSDSDGLADDVDECPMDAGLRRFQGCPDVDGDGTPDTEDRCPSIPGVERFDGCPDEDEDGVADGEDRCPSRSGGSGTDGCPGLSPEVRSLVDRPLSGVSFEPGQAILLTESRAILNRVSRTLRLHDHLNFEVQAHVHSQYSQAEAEALTADRATRVVSELVSLGIDPRRLTARGMGASQPIASNRTRRGRALNERLELRVIAP